MLIRLNWVLSTNRVDRLIQDWRLVHMGFRVAAGCAAQSFTCACTYSTFARQRNVKRGLQPHQPSFTYPRSANAELRVF